ncbi:hypothetical protein [Pseudonocardia acaciae]|uniref:hypothetical protein n=1 Tax=Pseudonocardia acaciae TaxID=551276 RepID=UPI00048E99F6|nr:hypothetical protein [Pseudonocardia acaciae]
MFVFSRAGREARWLRKAHKAQELIYRGMDDLSVYADAIRHRDDMRPITGDTNATVDYGAAGTTSPASYVTLIIEGPGYQWRFRLKDGPRRKADKIAQTVNTQAAIAGKELRE